MGLGQHAAQDPKERIADEHRRQPHGGDVDAQRGEPTIGKEDALDEQHHGHAERAGVGTDEHSGEHAAEEMATRAGRDGEVQHLCGEHEGRHDSGHGSGAFVELLASPAQADRHTGSRDDTSRHRHRRIDEAVRHVQGGLRWVEPRLYLVATRLQLQVNGGRTTRGWSGAHRAAARVAIADRDQPAAGGAVAGRALHDRQRPGNESRVDVLDL